MAKKSVIKNNVGQGAGQRETRPVWDNTARVNHQNKLTHPHPKRNFVPAAILTKSGQVLVNAAKQSSHKAAASVKSQEARKGVKSKNSTYKNSKGCSKMADKKELIPPLKKLVWVRMMHPNRGGKMIQMKNLMLLMRNKNNKLMLIKYWHRGDHRFCVKSSSDHMNDYNPSTPGKFKMDKSFHNRFRFFHYSSLAKLRFWFFIFLASILVFFFKSPTSSSSSYPLPPSMMTSSKPSMTSSKPSMTSSLAASDLYRRSLKTSSWGGPTWEKRVKSSARIRTRNGFCVLVTGLDNFNDYYEPSLKRARQALLERSGVYVVEGCLGALDTAEKSTGSGGKKRGPAQLRVFNLGNTSPVPVSDLVSILERLLKVKAKRMVMKLPRNGDVQFTHANISLAKREFGWYVSYYGSSKKSDQ
nr:UDP-glucuronate 4-epimerase 3-like [Tanacetum cinerariifolium]